MHIRTSTKRQGNKTHRYTQIVQSYRRKDGMPAHRVIANLGKVPEQAVENLRLAIRASREGKALVLAPDTPSLTEGSKVKANLKYLDIATMLEFWRCWGLGEWLEAHLPRTEATLAPQNVLAALVLQRCVAAGSKLQAQRWLPTTALPELLDIPPKKFNNTRLHRVLNDLHVATPRLQDELAALYQEHAPPSSAFFVDVTDTYFEGRGCELAQRSATKAGHRSKWSIGIVLLANEQGYPLRWQVISSRVKDNIAIADMLDQLQGLDWIQDQPLVCDRAMGKAKSLRKLLNSGLRFLTAASVNTIESYTKTLPHHVSSRIEVETTEKTFRQDILRVAQVARDIGLEEVDEQTFVLEQGLVGLDDATRRVASTGRAAAATTPTPDGATNLTADLWTARYLQAILEREHSRDEGAVAEAVGLPQSKVSQLLGLLRLAPDTQQRLLTSPRPVELPWAQLEPALQQTDPSQQWDMLQAALEASKPPSTDCSPADAASQSCLAEANSAATEAPVESRLRLVAYFNPQMFVEQRYRARKHLEEIGEFVADLNRELAHAARGRQEESTRRKILRKLEKYEYCDLFDVRLDPITVRTKAGSEIASFQCHVELKPQEWARRRRFNGFALLIGHPLLRHTARELALLYRSKDVIEKDFQTIKSVVKLRPVFHYTDPKVQAHVSICMLALLLQRSLEHRLREANLAFTAPACLEILRTCHLNLMKRQAEGQAVYSVTEPTAAQREILTGLGLGHLTEDGPVAQALIPHGVST